MSPLPAQIPKHFTQKKAQILAEISTHDSETYADKSPKGTIDAEIIDLIDEINALEGYVTTSSCAGRVAVFVEGRKTAAPGKPSDVTMGEEDIALYGGAGPGGKGYGNKWLFVSHSPIGDSFLNSSNEFRLHDIFGIVPRTQIQEQNPGVRRYPSSGNARMIKLSFSPLILHILCANLQAAKPLLAAAINAGFRESGVQSLKALDDPEAGVMVAIRTAGLTFETIVGFVEENHDGKEIYRSCIDEDFLEMCIGTIDERFMWNVERRERLREELKKIQQSHSQREWEDKDERRARKRLEGLRRQQEQQASRLGSQRQGEDYEVIFETSSIPDRP